MYVRDREHQGAVQFVWGVGASREALWKASRQHSPRRTRRAPLRLQRDPGPHHARDFSRIRRC
jgi:hypothetical protein